MIVSAVWLLFVVLLLLCTSTCNLDGGASGDNCPDCDGNDGQDDHFEPDPVVTELIAAADESLPAEDSLGRIQQALNEGGLSTPEAIELKTRAWFGHDEVPEQYTADDAASVASGRSTMRSDRQWVYENYQTLDGDDQALLEPFILPPDDPGSFFNPEYSSTSRNGGNWLSIAFAPESGPDAALIYYRDESGEVEQEVKAAWVKDALAKAWPKFTQLLGISPVNLIDVYLTDTGSDLGVATWKGDYCEICLGKTQDKEAIQTTAVHELFHCFQYEIPMQSTDEHEWLAEATAVWSEHYVYPADPYNSEWEHHDTFFSDTRSKRLTYDGSHEYGDYLFALFAVQYLETPGVIDQMLWASSNTDVPDLIYAAFDEYPEAYRQFSLYAFNRKRWKLFTDDPAFPDVYPKADSVEAYRMEEHSPPRDQNVIGTLAAGGIGYDLFTFGNVEGDIRSVEFDFSAMPADDEKLRRTGIFRIGGEWYEEDWSDRVSREFCRADPDGLITHALVIIANADLKSHRDIDFTVAIQGMCGSSSGFVRWTESVAEPDVKVFEAVYYQEDWLEYDPVEGAYVSTHCHKTYTMTDTTYFGDSTIQEVGSGVLDFTYSKDDTPRRLELSGGSTGGLLYIDTSNSEPSDWVTYTTSASGGFTSTESGRPAVGFGAGELRSFELEPDDFTDTGIKGERTIEYAEGGVTLTILVEFQYDNL